MGIFDNLMASSKEKRTMLYFKENGHFKFDKKEVEDSFLLEKKNGRVTRAWEDLRSLHLPFVGWKGIPRDEISLHHSRDVIFDPFNMIPAGENPAKYVGKKVDGHGLGAWISDITQTQQYKRQEESSKKMAQTTQMILMAIPAILMVMAAFIVILVNLKK
jgi:hypothetical protein